MKQLEMDSSRLRKATETPASSLVHEGDDSHETDEKTVCFWFILLYLSLSPSLSPPSLPSSPFQEGQTELSMEGAANVGSEMDRVHIAEKNKQMAAMLKVHT